MNEYVQAAITNFILAAYYYMYVIGNYEADWYETMSESDASAIYLGIELLSYELECGRARIVEIDGKDTIVFNNDSSVYAMGLSVDAILDCLENHIGNIVDYSKRKSILDGWTQIEIDEKIRRNSELREVIKSEGI